MRIIKFLIVNLFFLYHCKILDDKIALKEIKFNIINPTSLLESNENNLPSKSENINFSHTDINNHMDIMILESDYIITQIRWSKNGNYDLNYELGIFEGSNDRSFEDFVPLAMIKKGGEFNKVNYIDVTSPNTYKYIRYIPPTKNYSDINPIKFYGHKKTSSDLTDKKEFQVTNLPLISIYTENLTDPIKKDLDLKCQVVIINNGKIETRETGVIKIRGKSTAIIPTKKPYRLKFSTEQKILGQKGTYRKWILMANAFDRSLLRNSLAFKISQLMKFKYTQRCNPVDVILNGVFRGSYYLCDLIDIGKNRVNITKMKKTDKVGPNVTGGYLMEFDGGYFYGKKHYKTDNGILFKISNPDEDDITPEQEDYILDHMNIVENEVYNGILDKIDLDSFSKFFILNEFCGDIDFLWSSFYFYKERNDDKIYFGPVWDFDLALDNDARLIPTNDKDFFCFTKGDSAGTLNKFIQVLIGNKYVMEYIQKVWNELCETTLNEKVLLDYLEEREKYLKESSELNFLKWDNNFEKIPWEGPNYESEDYGRKGENFEQSVQVLKEYVKLRFKSFSKVIEKAVSLAK